MTFSTLGLGCEPLLLAGVRYRLDEPMCSTKAIVNPDYPTIYEHNAAWVREFLPFPSPNGLVRHMEKRYPLWESMMYPKGIAERVYHSSCVTSLMFEIDDLALLESALIGEVTGDDVADRPYGRALADSFGTLRSNMPSRVYERYIKEWQDWLASVLEENDIRNSRTRLSLDRYLELRRTSIGLSANTVCAEYVLGIDLTDEICLDPDLTALRDAWVEHGLLVNDLFSYRNEYFTGDYLNIVSTLLRPPSSNIQAAIDTTCAMIGDADRHLMALGEGLRERYEGHPRARQVRAYIDACYSMSAGNLRWSCETTRYNGHGYGWNGLRSGIVTIDQHVTIIDPR